MKNRKKKNRSIKIIIGMIVIAAVFLDLTVVREIAVEQGTYRLEEDFTSFSTPTTAVNVAIVPSDYTELSNPVSRSNSLNYNQVEDLVRKAVELQGGLDNVIKDKNDDGKIEVMLKPNIVEKNTPSGWGTNTDVRVIKALIKVIGEHTQGVKIYVAEGCPRSGYDDPNSATSSWEASGYRDLLTDNHLSGIDFELFNLNQPYEDLVEIDLGTDGTAAPHNFTFKVHKKEIEVDVFITVPVLKIHGTGITCALKNQIGTAPGAYYGYNKCGGTKYCGGLVHQVAQRCWTTEEIVDLCQIAGIDFVVVDAIMCLESKKTYDGNNQVRFNTVVAGCDPVAVDHVCAKLMCLNPDDIAHVTLAEKVGIGTNNPDFINIVGAPINDVKKKVKKSTGLDGEFGQSNRTWLMSKAFTGEDISVENIANEATCVPEALKEDWSAPTYFFDDRVDLTSYFNGQKGIISYAFSYFYSPEEKEAELWIGYDEDIIVYINGNEIFSHKGLKVFGESALYQEKVRINILEGENTLMVKTLQKYGTYEFSLNICDLASAEQYGGNRVAGLKFYTDTLGHNNNSASIINKNLSVPLTCYPNPATEFSKITYSIPGGAVTTINIYDLNGKLVENLEDRYLQGGQYEIQWNTNQVRAGIYFCKIRSGNYENSIKVIVR